MEQCTCIVLSMMPYRESSRIATLLSRNHGRVGGIAKGIRRSPSQAMTLERGQIVDCVLYYRPHRELHTMAQVSVVEFFGAIRSDLGKLSLRDAAFEIILKTLTATEAHPELFDYAASFLRQLEAAPVTPLPLPLFWRFIAGWSALLGFRITTRECLRCGSNRIAQEGGRLSPDQDGIICRDCAPDTVSSPLYIPAPVLRLVDDAPADNQALFDVTGYTVVEQLRITGLLTDYLRYHFDIRSDLKTVGFLKSILMT
jgi:DNA repair protein RecO